LVCWTFCCDRGAARIEFERQKQSPMENVIAAKAGNGKTPARRSLSGSLLSGSVGTERGSFPPRVFAVLKSAPQDGRGIGILAEGRWVSLAQNLDHPVIEVIDRMIEDGLKTPVIFFMSLLNIISQPHANVFMFTPQPDVVGTEHLDILHGNFGDTIGTPV
jgi:hypothetical protein